MGAVYVAEHAVLRRTAAIKMLHPSLTMHAQVTQRFINEGLAASMLDSDHIIKILDCQKDPPSGMWWIAMEHLHGQALSTYIAAHAPLPLSKAIQIGCQVAEALDEAHANGIVHRDIKPDNIYLITRGSNSEFVKVLDFGIAKLRREDAGVVTKTNTVIGTQPFMPPEQLRGQPIDHRVDVFALGVVLYLMLSNGRHPFQNHDTLDQFYQLNSAELCIRQLNQDPIDLRQWAPGVPDAVAKVLASALHRDREQRPSSAGDLMVELARAGDGLETVKAYSKLLQPNPARRSIQYPVQDAPKTLPPQERATVRIGVPAQLASTAPEPAATPHTTLGAATGETAHPPVSLPASARRARVLAAFASIAVAGAAAGAIVWITRDKDETNRDQIAVTVPAGRSSDASVEASAPPDAATEVTPGDDAGSVPLVVDSGLLADAGIANADTAAVAAGVSEASNKTTQGIKTGQRSAKQEVRAATGLLSVAVSETFANVYLDGKLVGSTPLSLQVPVGGHKVTLVNGPKRETINVNVTRSKPTVIERPW